MKYDFSGYATRNGVRCTDGRTIMKDAFRDNDGTTVPLVWQHDHSDPSNILGKVKLENRPDGVYAFGKFNDTPAAQDAKLAVRHGDITAMSIYANHVKQESGLVQHGNIREVSLVLSGANPGAFIDNVSIAHGDETLTLDDEIVIYSGEEFAHDDSEEQIEVSPVEPEETEFEHKEAPMADTETKDAPKAGAEEKGGKTVQQVIDSMTEEQKKVLYALVGMAAEGEGGDEEVEQSEGDYDMYNAFEGDGDNEFRHADEFVSNEFDAVFDEAKRNGRFSDAVIRHAQNYGITNIDILFPDAQAIRNTPDFYGRRTEWVNTVLNGTQHVPFTRIKSMYADITADEARARGYTLDRNNNKRKIDEVFNVLKRVTTPQTVYKKQKLDRDDIIDITSFDVVAWLKQEMRIMLDEEIARAVLIGDGRDVSDESKIRTDSIRPIAFDDDLYTIKVEITDVNDVTAMIDQVTQAQVNYRGSGSPTFFASPSLVAKMMTQRDQLNHRMYSNRGDLASELSVSNILDVPIMDQATTEDGRPILGLIGNLKDYTIGADRGGNVSMFDDFDIDFNQQKYLMETRCSGALTLPKSFIAILGPKA
jgi:HK97 family phage prohead protease